jgi:hypothetical protein
MKLKPRIPDRSQLPTSLEALTDSNLGFLSQVFGQGRPRGSAALSSDAI